MKSKSRIITSFIVDKIDHISEVVSEQDGGLATYHTLTLEECLCVSLVGTHKIRTQPIHDIINIFTSVANAEEMMRDDLVAASKLLDKLIKLSVEYDSVASRNVALLKCRANIEARIKRIDEE
jgi:hypothetical protein